MNIRSTQPLTDVFDYREHSSIFIPVGFELMRLKQIIETHGNSFEEFLDDFITALRIRTDSSMEYFLFKNNILYFGYLRIAPNQTTQQSISTLMDSLYQALKKQLVEEKLYVGGRFDYSVNLSLIHI